MVVFQGVSGAYSQSAARVYFARAVKTRGLAEFEDVFAAVWRGESAYGVVPIENSLTGSIHQNYDLFLKYPVWICGETKLRISHALVAAPAVKFRQLRQVYSHPQGLWQCQRFLRRYPRLEKIAYFDTAGSVKYLKESGRKDAAAIASVQAANCYGMRVLKTGIEDSKQNFTRFLVLQRRPKFPRDSAVKTSILLILKNLPGALHQALGVFADLNIQVVKVESRPIAGKPWQYLFYLDFLASPRGVTGRPALNALDRLATTLKVLGVYSPV